MNMISHSTHSTHSHKVMRCKKTNDYGSNFEQLMYKSLMESYTIFQNNVRVVDDNADDMMVAMLIKDFFTDEEYTVLQDYTLNLHNQTYVYKMELPVDPSIEHISHKVNKLNKTENKELVDHFNIFHVFDNYLVDIHRDSDERSIKNLFVVKCAEVKGLTVFPELKIAFMLEPKDILLFDTNLLHYVSTNMMVSKKRYRYAMYFE